MKLLSLSTAEQGASLAIVQDEHLICETYWDARQTHSRRLLPMIEEMAASRAGFGLSDLDGFVAARGPGSFTGLRIGLAVVKGLGFALGKPCFGVSSLDGIAFQFAHSAMPVCVMMDARRGEVYSAVYRFEKGTLASKSREQALVPEKACELAGQEDVLYAGSGAKAYRGVIEALADQPLFSSHHQDPVSAAALIRAMNTPDTRFDPVAAAEHYPLEPVYLRKSDAQVNLEKQSSKFGLQ